MLTGHSGLSNATLFDDLPDIAVGDAIYVAVAGHRLEYEVDQIVTVLPDQTDDLAVNPSLDQLTLITCTPYGINTHRLLVRAHQVPLDPEDAAVFDDGVGLPWQWWMWALLGGAAVVLAGITWWAVRTLRAGRADTDDGDSDAGADRGEDAGPATESVLSP